MDEEDEPAWTCAASKPKTLNEDPFNVYAEELAMEVCKVGFEVARELLETDLVFSSCGTMVQGTPDGGFRDAAGLLRLVQVVRVPLLPEMDEDEVADIFYDTVLAKVVKSQVWMKETATLPHEFIIFCWLPPVGAYKCLQDSEALLWTDALLWNLRDGGWPFSLVVKVPEEPGCLFPKNFGQRNYFKEKKDYTKQVVYFLNPSDFEEAEEDFMDFDLFDVELESEDLESETQDVLKHVLFAIQLLQQEAWAEAAGAKVFTSLGWAQAGEDAPQRQRPMEFFQVDGASWDRARVDARPKTPLLSVDGKLHCGQCGTLRSLGSSMSRELRIHAPPMVC